ncbi:hypothetical protein IG631_21936 [Alternaria alternata]|nr:hypothetical protein IG631_21936 [Alternaria alternata]
MFKNCYAEDDEHMSTLRLFNQEVLLSYRLLFGQTKASRQYYHKNERTRVMPSGGEVDPLLDILCSSSGAASLGILPEKLWPPSCCDYEGHLLEHSTYSTALDFPVLGTRLLKIQDFDTRHTPYKLRELWRDRRQPLQWYAFWAVLIVGGATIVIGLCQIVLSIVQLGVSSRDND